MKNKLLLVLCGTIILVIVIITFNGSSNKKTELLPVKQNNNISGEISINNLAKNPTAYDGKIISIKGTIIGIRAVTYSQSQIDENDYEANLVDNNQEIYLSISKHPEIKQFKTGNIVKISGKFSADQSSIGVITINDTGSISFMNNTNDVLSPSSILKNTTKLLSTEKSKIDNAISNSGYTSSFNQCMTEYQIIWDNFCSKANLPNNCMALYYTNTVKLINNSLNNLSKNCYKKFSSTDSNSLNLVLKTIISASNDSGASIIPLLSGSVNLGNN